jgi:hypothetical protein
MVTNIAIERREIEHNFLCFCSLICLLSGKKLNLPNIFLLLLKTPTYKQILKKLVSIDTDYELFKLFIDFDPSLSKSKYISKFLNSREGKVIIANNVKQF